MTDGLSHVGSAGPFSCRRQSEWTTSLALFGFGAQFILFPVVISKSMFRDLLVIASPEMITILVLAIASYRIVALILNGNLPFWGPIMRSMGAALTAVVWLQMWLSLLRLEPDLPRPVSIPIFIALMLTDFVSAYRAATDVRT